MSVYTLHKNDWISWLTSCIFPVHLLRIYSLKFFTFWNFRLLINLIFKRRVNIQEMITSEHCSSVTNVINLVTNQINKV